ncbi:MAG: radical SAM protein [Armatimonadota bacterium]
MSEIGVNKLFFHPDKVNKLLAIARAPKFKFDTSYPVSVELSLTNKCNLKCIWCVDWHLRKSNKKEIKFEILKKLILDLAHGGTRGITIEGGGEPTVYSHFKDLMKFINNVDIKFGLITNGVLIPYSDSVEKFEWIRISLDVDNAENYAKYKKGNKKDYNKIFSNIEKLVNRSNKKTVVGVSYIATKYNLLFINDVIDRLKNIGVDYFYIRPIEDNEELLPYGDELEGIEDKADKDFKVLVNYNERLACGNASLPCVAHSLSSVITADSDVYLCGRLHIHREWGPIGNLNKNTFNELWHSKQRQSQSLKVYNSRFTSKYCPVCRMTKFNKELYDLKNIKTVNFV